MQDVGLNTSSWQEQGAKEGALRKARATLSREGMPAEPTRASASTRTSLYSTVTLGSITPASMHAALVCQAS
jgi:hypothetical protein